MYSLALIIFVVSQKKAFEHFPIGSNVNLSCDGGHLGFPIGIKNSNLVKDEPNLAGMFLGWSSTKLLFFVPVGYSIWLPRPIICSDWLKFQRSSSLKLMN
jgi:hypothetical protein